jgi:putative ABC transport system permease protein
MLFFETVGKDLRYGLRSLLAQPVLYAAALGALALGIGANTTIFSVVRTVLLRPLPYAEPERLVTIYETSPQKGIQRYFLSSSDYFDWQDRSRTLEGFGGYWRNENTITDRYGDPERVAGVAITPSLIRTLGIRLIAGRIMTEAEGQANAPDVALITFEYWMRRYHGDPSIVGQSFGLNSHSTPVIGILPPGIHFAGDAQVWSVLQPYRPRPTPRFMEGVARLRPGITLAQARAEMDAVARSIAAEFPDTNAGWGAGLRPMLDDLTAGSRLTLVALFVSVTVLLLIACVNVANLLLAQSAARQREVAIRAALGAGGRRLVRQFFTESLLLAAGGGTGGIVAAIGGVRLVRAFGPDSIPRIQEVVLDLPVLAYTFGVSVVVGLLFGMAPVLRLRNPNLAAAMAGAGRGTTGSAAEGSARSALVIAQVALAVVLVNTAGLLIRSFVRLSAVNPGFHPENVLTASISLPPPHYPKVTDVSAAYAHILSAVSVIPGVRAAGTTTSLPLAPELDYRLPFWFSSRPAPPHLEDQTAWHRMVSPGLFSALGTQLIAGRDFTAHDNPDSPPVVIVNETLARQYWTSGTPIGQKLRAASGGFGPLGRILLREPAIIGVVSDIKYAGLGRNPEPAIYFPSLQAPFYSVSLVIRTDASLAPEALIGSVRRQLRDVDPDLPMAHVRTMREQVADSVSQPRVQALLIALFSVLALALGSIGIYGVLSYTVAIRMREIGIRCALGARPSEIMRHIVGHGIRLVVIGTAAGIVASLAASRLVGNLLFQVRPADWSTYAVSVGVLAGIGLLASYLPARSASLIDPNIALRDG